MQATVADVIEIMESLAPPWLAEDWDNVGLQIGNPQLPAKRIWIALDPIPKVIKAACKHNVDILITHHPLIFRPLKRIDLNTPVGGIIQMAVQHQLAVYSAHTNFDIVKDGVNDILGQRLQLQNLDILHPVKPDVAALDESENFVHKNNSYGIGRIGTLSETVSLKTLVSMVKKELELDYVKVAGNLKKKVFRVAVCSGSGSSLMKAFLSSNADVYISGDIHYHDARDAEAVQRAIIDIGHFASEHLLVEALAERLDKRVRQAGLEVTVRACSIEEDPFAVT